jgi:uncharacterized membrane protein YvbJ
MYCKECRKQIADNSKFCKNCGKPQDNMERQLKAAKEQKPKFNIKSENIFSELCILAAIAYIIISCCPIKK